MNLYIVVYKIIIGACRSGVLFIYFFIYLLYIITLSDLEEQGNKTLQMTKTVRNSHNKKYNSWTQADLLQGAKLKKISCDFSKYKNTFL